MRAFSGSFRKISQLKVTLAGLSIILLISTLFGYLAGISLFFELCSHMRLQLLWASIVTLVIQLLFKKHRTLSITIISLLINLWELSPLYISPALPNVPRTTHLKLLHSNVLSSNTNYQRLLDLIETEEPDVVILQEVTSRWLQKVKTLKKIYPFFLEHPREDNFGIALFSKKKLINPQVIRFEAVPSIEATITNSGKSIELLATHPPPPVNPSYFSRRNRQLDKITKWSKQHHASAQIIIGDLNITPWATNYKRLITETELYNTRQGFGVCPSWPSFSLPPLMIPIDHCLVSKSIKVESFKTGNPVGSDHLPIVVNLSY